MLSLDAIRKSLPEGAPNTAAILDAMKAGLRESVADVRRVNYELRPPALDELGLVGAIARQATALSHQGNMTLELIAPSDHPLYLAGVRGALEERSASHRCRPQMIGVSRVA